MKCIQYWPENSETNQFETVDVTHQETLEFEDHVERTFSLRHKKVIMAYFTVACVAGVRKGRGRELGRETTRAPRVSLAPKTPFPKAPFPFPFKRLPRRLILLQRQHTVV